MAAKSNRTKFFKRMIANVAAIAAISTIFGAKALELERREAAAADASRLAITLSAGPAETAR